MEGRQANHAFNIYAYSNNEQTDHLGGADDLASAATLAAAAFVAKQGRSPENGWGVGVLADMPEGEDSLVAYVGWHQGE